jgi:hypothetical protein
LPQGNQTEVLEAIRREALSSAELGGVVDLWLRCSERRQQEYLLAHPREALSQAKGALPAVRDPRLSEAGNQVWKRVGLLLDVLGRMEVWLAHQGRTGLTPEDRVILLPRHARRFGGDGLKSSTPKRPASTSDLSLSERRLVAALQQLAFGRLESVRIRHGELVLDPWPTAVPIRGVEEAGRPLR